MKPPIVAAIDRLQDWHVHFALPLWARAGVDPNGGFYESLDFSGRSVRGPRRVRVQSRQIHTFSDAAKRGWLPEGEKIAAAGFARLIESACPNEATRGCVHLIGDDGAILDAMRDLYDQAFLLLACASRLAAGAEGARKIAERTLRFIERELTSPHGGYEESDRGGEPRRQNPHMHLFEAAMALYSASRDPSHLSLARAIERLFASRFLDRNAGVLREFFADDWSLDPVKGDLIEPGHMMEWIYLLDRFEMLTGEDRSREKRLLYRSARAMIAPKDPPFLPNSVELGAAPARQSRRLWPQTESLRASLVMARNGDDAAREHAETMIAALFDTYLDAEPPGLWRDEYDAKGGVVAKAVPASILYHLHEAVSCAAESRHRLAS